MQGSIAVRYAVLLFLPWGGLRVFVLLQLPEGVPHKLYFLPAVSAGLAGGVDDTLFHELIDDGGRPFPNAQTFTDNGGEAIKIGSVLRISINNDWLCSNERCQFLLLRFILGGQLQKPFMLLKGMAVTVLSGMMTAIPLYVLLPVAGVRLKEGRGTLTSS